MQLEVESLISKVREMRGRLRGVMRRDLGWLWGEMVLIVGVVVVGPPIVGACDRKETVARNSGGR